MKIFLIIFDTLRKDHSGKTYGNDWIHTPNFDAFAKDSIVFYNAYPESLATIPVRRAIHTGIRTFPFNHPRPELRTDDPVIAPGWHPIPPYQIHLSEYLKKFKFVSSFITSTYHQFKPHMNFHIGFDEWNWIRGHEFDKYRAVINTKDEKFNELVNVHLIGNEKARTTRKMQRRGIEKYLMNVQERKTEDDYFPAQTFNEAIRFVRNSKNLENVLAVIDEFDPHEPWDPPQRFLELYVDKNYKGKKVILPSYSDNLSYLLPGELEYMRAGYAGEVSNCDYWFGKFIEELKALELYDDSLIILISDHGHSIGEHGATGKIHTHMYPELVDIPFMIKPPRGVKGPKRIKKTYVYDHDILPTIYGFLGKKQEEVFDGIDLSVFLDEKDQLIGDRNYITCGFNAYTLYKDDHYALITSNNKRYQKLFDLSKDPEWNDNIVADNPDIYEELFEKIEKDAGGELLLEFKLIKDLKQWYLDQR